jgi:hypothetical protein
VSVEYVLKSKIAEHQIYLELPEDKRRAYMLKKYADHIFDRK